MNGTVRCAKCDAAMVASLCNECGSQKGKVYISFYWEGQHYKIRRDREGDIFWYDKAERYLTLMRADIDRRKFDIDAWLSQKIAERNFCRMFEKFLKEKEEDAEGNGKAPSTVKTYRSHYKNHLSPFFNKIDVREAVERMKIKSFYARLKKNKKIDVNFKQHVLDTLKTFMNWLCEDGVVESVPPFLCFAKVKRKKVALDRQDQALALEGFPEGLADVYEFGMEIGVRPGELAAIEISDLDLRARIIWIMRTYSACKLKDSTKENSAKPVPLSDRAFQLALKHSSDRNPWDFLFLNPVTGRGWTYNRLSKYWNKYSKVKVKLNEAIRHSFGTQLAEMGASEGQLQDLLRHADPRSVREYTHANVIKYRELVNDRGKVVQMVKTGTSPERVFPDYTPNKSKS